MVPDPEKAVIQSAGLDLRPGVDDALRDDGRSESLMRRYSGEGIGLASETNEIVSLPPLRVEGLREIIDGTHTNGPKDSNSKEEPQA